MSAGVSIHEVRRPQHLPACSSHTLAETYPDEPRPADVSEVAWTQVRFARCAPGCPTLQRSIERGHELAEVHGW